MQVITQRTGYVILPMGSVHRLKDVSLPVRSIEHATGKH